MINIEANIKQFPNHQSY